MAIMEGPPGPAFDGRTLGQAWENTWLCLGISIRTCYETMILSSHSKLLGSFSGSNRRLRVFGKTGASSVSGLEVLGTRMKGPSTLDILSLSGARDEKERSKGGHTSARYYRGSGFVYY